MKSEHLSLLERSKTERKELVKTLEKWKKRPKDMDAYFHKQHELVFRRIDCLECANCCKTTSPIFRDIDIRRISKYLRVKEKEFISNYLKMDDEGDYVLQMSPCVFLGSDNKCSIYSERPLACREYPHTDRKNVSQINKLTIENSLICPAVAAICQDLKEQSK